MSGEEAKRPIVWTEEEREYARNWAYGNKNRPGSAHLRAALSEINRLARLLDEQEKERVGWKADAESLAHSLATAKVELSRLRRVEDAARALGAEVCGVLYCAEPEMRGVAGNTNVNCLRRRYEELAAALDGKQEVGNG